MIISSHMNENAPVRISKNVSERLTASMKFVLYHETKNNEVVALWSDLGKTLTLGPAGYKALSEAADDLRKNGTNLRTYPKKYLVDLLARTIIATGDHTAVIPKVIATLNEQFHKQIALVPFWGVGIEDRIVLQFGPYRLKKLGAAGFHKEVVMPLRSMGRAFGHTKKRISDDVKDLIESVKHVPNVPILTVTYDGSREGAGDFVAVIAENVANFLQFIAAPLVGRNGVRPIDHRGAYFGRFSTFMPVLSYDARTSKLVSLSRPNLRDNPHGPTITKQLLRDFKKLGGYALLPFVADGPSKSDTPMNMLLRAIQLFADGERAMSERQAIVSYVAACEALFNHREKPEKYACTGIALAFGGDFLETLELAESVYDERSRAAHLGLNPTLTMPARRFAYRSITYIITNFDRFKSKRAIRAWIESGFQNSE